MTVELMIGPVGVCRIRPAFFGELHMNVPSHRILFAALPILSIAAWPAGAEPQIRLAQAQIQIPSDAQLDRMERQGIVTPPLYDGGGAADGSIGAENRQMEEQAHRIDEKLLGGGICSGC